MADKRALTYVEIDVDHCSLTYGTAPCTAAIPTTGSRKCFNSLGTCQDRSNFTNVPVTYRFGIDCGYLPQDIDCIPCVTAINVTPAVISLGKNLGERATVNITFKDHRHSDGGTQFDKYLSTRGYDPYTKGTFFGRWKARNPYLRGRSVRVYSGFLGQSLAEMSVQHFIAESFSGPDAKGNYTIQCKDMLKLADNDIAKAPYLSDSYLAATLVTAATSCTLSPAGVGDAEFPLSGYAAIGGEEIVAFRRDPGSANSVVKLLLHGDGTNGSTTITDSSPVPHTCTAAGNTALSTTTPKFGTASIAFDGTADYVSLDGSADFAFGTGDFQIEMWIYLTTLGSTRVLYDSRPASTNGLYPMVYITTANTVRYYVNSADRITGATTVSASTWTHVALTRISGVTRLFVGGVLQGSTYADTNDYLNGASRPLIGADGQTLGNSSFIGRIDEVRVLKGHATWDAAFTPPITVYASTDSDRLHLTRAQYSTTARDHDVDDRVQLCLRYLAQDPADIVYDLLANYAGIDPAYLPLTAWRTETQNYLQRVYTTLIAQPTGVNQLLSELAEQAALAMWWDETARVIRLQVLRQIPTTAYTFDEAIYIEDTFSAKEQPNTRLSEVWTYFGQRNPLLKLDETKNYRSAVATVDLQAETDYGTAQIKQVFSRWIPFGGRTIAQRLNNLVLGRFRDPPRRFAFALMRDNDANITPGGGYQIDHWSLQDDTGEQVPAPIQVTRVSRTADVVTVEAEEMLWTEQGTLDDPNLHVIVIDADTYNVNLRTLHDTLYAPITVPTGITVRCVIAAGVTVGSVSSVLPALDVGSWVASLAVEIVVEGRIQGKGGAGGTFSGTTATAGEDGGTALYTRYPVAVKLDTGAGEIWGGGGGGGASKHALTAPGNYIAGGGGGQGFVIGAGGTSIGATNGTSGTKSTAGAGGTVGGVQKGGNAGTAGQAGQAGQHTPAIQNGAGGAAGRAVDGVSFVTYTGAGSRLGPEVN